jgi:hypothetical protein
LFGIWEAESNGRIICCPAIKNDSGEMILSRLHSSVHALGDKIQDSYQRRE